MQRAEVTRSAEFAGRRRPFRAAAAMVAPMLVLATAVPSAAAATATAAPAGPAAVVVAVDTSRSLSASELAAAAGRLRSMVEALPAGTPAGLLAFDDRPRWVRPVGTAPAAVAAALGELAPAGRFTLLHDALFAAARALPDGGVVVVATDGRDENSATTVDDIARRCEAQGVRILTLGAGARRDERLLRRLALLTDGAYLGAAEAPAAEAAGALEAAQAAVAAERAAAGQRAGSGGGDREAPVERAAGGGGETGAGAREGGESSGEDAEPAAGDAGTRAALSPWLLAGGLAALLAALAALALARGRRRRAAAEAAAAEEEVAAAVARTPAAPVIPHGLAETLAAREAAPPGSAEELKADTAVIGPDPDDTLEQTRVLAERAVLMVKEPGDRAPRTFLLRADRAFSVGRHRERNTLALADPALSSQHFRIVPEDGRFFLLDLRSTNGTYVNGERVGIRELASGDAIHAGQVECNFRSFAQPVDFS